MSFKDLVLKTEYRSLIDSMAADFYIPVLKESKLYQRSAGFFSSTSLVHVTKGLCQFIKNGGHIQIVACPILSEEDIQAIKTGYERRKEIIYGALLRSLEPDDVYFGQERLNLLANLIADGYVDIKIAVTTNDRQLGIYHEKMGIFTDFEGNRIAFSGSPNATYTAMELNYESMNVFCDWNEGLPYVTDKVRAFESIWSNREPNIEVTEFPELSEEIIKRYKREKPDYELDKKEFGNVIAKTKAVYGFRIGTGIGLYDYQTDAIDKWQDNGYRGIFDMATGTGKSYTGLGAASRLCEAVNDKLAVFIVCPYQHLVDQWCDDIRAFGVEPIIAYSKSPQKDWKLKLKKAIMDQKVRKDKPFFCVATTNATFAGEFIQNEVRRIKSEKLLLIDEAHNFGAERLQTMLDDNIYEYRLALTATLDRHYDDEGTDALKRFFGEKCSVYDIERAIDEHKLTPYYYYPVVVNLTEEELQKYDELTDKMRNNLTKGKDGRTKLNQFGKQQAIQRARIVAAAYNKLDSLREQIEPYKDKNYMLVYCGAANVEYEVNKAVAVEMRQIEAVTRMLGNELGMRIAKFTADEKIEERNRIKEGFKNGKDIQAVVAIKCLDEGVNIPAIRTAFILASTTNPKEYIQRRGRVLRLSDNKDFAEIYDFVTLPRPLDDVGSQTEKRLKMEVGLVRNELNRIKEFSRLALNGNISLDLIWEIEAAYHLDSGKSDELEDLGYE